MARLVLIDGNAVMHRAFHAIPSLTNSKGEPTNAVYGFISMLLRVIEELHPSHLAVTFDRPKPTFRKKMFADYQAQRPEMDSELVPQIKRIHEVVKAMQLPIYELDGFEADDVIGTITQQATSKSEFRDVIVVTGDRDLLQLVNKRVKLYMPVKGLSEAKLYGEKEAEERMGVKPVQIPDFKALAGDPSDNYSGVAGIGPKTAVGLLKQYDSVENIYKQIDKIPAKVATKLRDSKENAMLSHKLAQVVTSAPIKFSVKEAKVPADFLNQEVIAFFGRMGFKTLLKRMGKLQQVSKPKPEQKKTDTKIQMELF